MNLLELINSRHSYRGEYENTPVPREDQRNKEFTERAWFNGFGL